MNKALFAATWLLWFLTAGPVAGQAFLERLEQQLRRQTAPAGSPTLAPQDTAAAAQPPANPSAGSARPTAAETGGSPAPERGYLGVVTDDRLDRGRGVRITEVRPGAPAEKAGLKVQDLITGLGGIRVRQMADLAAILEQVAPGGSLKFDILRGNQPLQLEVTFGKRPDGKPATASRAPRLPMDKPADLELVAPSFPDPATPASGAGTLRAVPPPTTPPAASENLQTDRQRIEALERRIKSLEERIQQLEREKAAKK